MYYYLCPDGNCSFSVPLGEEEANFCPLCGKELVKECPNCKSEIKEKTQIFCRKCGTRLKDDRHILV